MVSPYLPIRVNDAHFEDRSLLLPNDNLISDTQNLTGVDHNLTDGNPESHISTDNVAGCDKVDDRMPGPCKAYLRTNSIGNPKLTNQVDRNSSETKCCEWLCHNCNPRYMPPTQKCMCCCFLFALSVIFCVYILLLIFK